MEDKISKIRISTYHYSRPWRQSTFFKTVGQIVIIQGRGAKSTIFEARVPINNFQGQGANQQFSRPGCQSIFSRPWCRIHISQGLGPKQQFFKGHWANLFMQFNSNSRPLGPCINCNSKFMQKSILSKLICRLSIQKAWVPNCRFKRSISRITNVNAKSSIQKAREPN